MDTEHVTDMINKSARIVAHQMRLFEKLQAESADTTEAEHLLAYFATAAIFLHRNAVRKANAGVNGENRCVKTVLHAAAECFGYANCPEARLVRIAACPSPSSQRP